MIFNNFLFINTFLLLIHTAIINLLNLLHPLPVFGINNPVQNIINLRELPLINSLDVFQKHINIGRSVQLLAIHHFDFQTGNNQRL